MAEETATNPPPVNQLIDDARNDFGSESAVRVTSSSPTRGAALMADEKIPEMFNFFKKMTVTDAERQGYHDVGWLTGNLLSSIPEVDVPTIDGFVVLFFKSHLIARLGFPPSKFLVSIMKFHGCSLIHFNPNTLTTCNTPCF
jgi:hypothetical protein